MGIELQKAGLWKRIAAWGLDLILVCILAVGAGYLLAKALNYDGYNATLQSAYDRYESRYGVTFDITAQEYEAMSQAERDTYDTAYGALIADEPAMQAYNMLLSISLAVTSLSILFSVLVLELMVPLVFKNGQSIGKKLMGLGVIRNDGVRANTMQLFVRALLGKFTLEIMVPVLLVLMMFWGILDRTGTVVLCVFAIVQMCLYCFTRNNAVLHDLLAGTAVVEIASQRVFPSTEALVEYVKQEHARQAAKKEY